MCLLVLAWNVHPRFRLIVAANRDEYHDRPAEPLRHWPSPEEMLAGRDLRAGGTWLGVDRRRRFGVVTNYRDPRPAPDTAPSRGGLIPGFLGQAGGPGEYLSTLEPAAGDYGGFNLLLADGESLWYGSNRTTPFARELAPGVYGLSNERLDTPWPKLQRVRAGFQAWLGANAAASTVGPAGACLAQSGHIGPAETPAAAEQRRSRISLTDSRHVKPALDRVAARNAGGPTREDIAPLFSLLEDRRPAAEAERSLPGGPPQWERALSAPFVEHPQYGTRCSTVVLIDSSGSLLFAERRFDRHGRCAGESAYRLRAREWPQRA